MASSGVNVLRYSALGLGIFYGFYHQRQIYAADRKIAIQQEYEHKQELINKAKAEYAKSKQPASASSSSTTLDLNDPKFDLEAVFKNLDKTAA
ncbi:ATP synthase [Podospora australis]|uniref:ATP synthase F(0) complex subunit e, mitochondrial n=1 Tax=Podospora australis TaxID=1536484 RepID=A0AAN7ANR3_9PEZI|nr:ATP synthase [Podospora australis]